MRPTHFWTSTLVVCVIVSLVFDWRAPLFTWLAAGAFVLVVRGLGDAARRRRASRQDAALAHAAVAHAIGAGLDADAAIAEALSVARAAHARASTAISSRMAPTLAVELAGIENDLAGFARSSDPAADVCRARAIEQRASVAAGAAATRGIPVRTARGLGAVLGIWRSLDH